MNMVFLINIIRILVMKLRSTPTNEPSQFRYNFLKQISSDNFLPLQMMGPLGFYIQEGSPCDPCLVSFGIHLLINRTLIFHTC